MNVSSPRSLGRRVVSVLAVGAMVMVAGAAAVQAQPGADPAPAEGAIVVGVPGEAIAGLGDTAGQGVAQIVLADGSDQALDQENADFAAGSTSAGATGSAVAVGDFDGDGLADVAIGSPDEAPGGVVRVVPGAVYGFDTSATVLLTQSGPIPGTPEAGDEFGATLAVGDFNGDGYDDLAIGVPGEAIGTVGNAGAVAVVPGSETGLVIGDAVAIDLAPQVDGRFGDALAAGDFDADGNDDLAVAAAGADDAAGKVAVFAGSDAELFAGEATELSQLGPMVGAQEDGDGFGSALAAGDFDGDGAADLAIGVAGEDVGAVADAGAVVVLPGVSGDDFDLAASYSFSQRGPIAGTPEAGDGFGTSLAAGDFDGDGNDDLAIGAPGEDLGATTDAGAVAIAEGSVEGLVPTTTSFTQSGPIAGTPEAGDGFGAALATGDHDGDIYDDLAVGVPNEDIGALADGGMVTMVLGTAAGLSDAGTVSFTQTGVTAGTPEAGDRFGAAVAVAQVNPLDTDTDGTPDGIDCDPTDPDIHPGADDIEGNGIDEDCSGSDAVLQSLVDSTQTLGTTNSQVVAFGDVDGDGDLDIAEGNLSQPNRIWLNDGNGVYTDSGQTLGNSATLDLVFGDVDGDDDLDLVEGNSLFQPNRVWLNNGSGVFASTAQALGADTTRAVALADVNGDDDLDLIELNEGAANRVLINNGSGTFTNTGQPLGNDGSTTSLAVGDIDGDDDIDVVVGRATAANLVWFNNGLGSFTVDTQALGSWATLAVDLADVDGDDDLDLVAGNFGVTDRIWLNDGDGVFADTNQLLDIGDTTDVVFMDVEGDGDVDLAVGSLGAANTVWVNDGAGTFSDSGMTLGTSDTNSIAVGDVDGDLDLDLADGNANQANLVWINPN